MTKIKKAMYVFYSLAVASFLLLAAVQLKLWGSFEYPEQADYVSFLVRCRTAAIPVFLMSVAVTVALRCLYHDISGEISFLESRIAKLEKNIESFKK